MLGREARYLGGSEVDRVGLAVVLDGCSGSGVVSSDAREDKWPSEYFHLPWWWLSKELARTEHSQGLLNDGHGVGYLIQLPRRVG